MKNTIVLVLIGLLMSGVAFAGDAAKGKAKAAVCSACHGATGISSNPLWPNLAGQKEQYLAVAIKAYRDGKREDANMAPMVSTLTDEEIADLAAYFAQQKGCE